MSNIALLIEDFLSENPPLKKYPDYLSMKNGIIPLKVGYN